MFYYIPQDTLTYCIQNRRELLLMHDGRMNPHPPHMHILQHDCATVPVSCVRVQPLYCGGYAGYTSGLSCGTRGMCENLPAHHPNQRSFFLLITHWAVGSCDHMVLRSGCGLSTPCSGLRRVYRFTPGRCMPVHSRNGGPGRGYAPWSVLVDGWHESK